MVDEAKVGLIFVVLLVAAFVSLTYVTGYVGWSHGQHVVAHFRNVEGLGEGAKVLLAGKEIGRVLSIELATEEELKQFPDRSVLVHLLINRDVQLLDTDEFLIAQSGMLGDTTVMVRRKTQQERELEAQMSKKQLKAPQPLGAQAHVAGERIAGLTELTEDGRVVLQNVNAAIADLRSVYASSEVRERLPLILANVQDATRNAAEFTQMLARVSVQNEARVGTLAREVAAAATELNRSAARVRQMVVVSAPDVEGATSRVARMIDASAGNVEAVSGSLARTGARLEKMVDSGAGDVETSARLVRETMEKSSGNIQETASHLAKTSAMVEDVTRSAGADLTATAQRVRELVEKSSVNVEQAAAQVEKATTSLATLVADSGKDLSASTQRVNAMVQKAATDLETSSANLAALSGNMNRDLSAAAGRAQGLIEKSSTDVEKVTGRIATMVESSASDIEQTTRRIHDLLALSPLPNDLAASGAHIREATTNIEEITKTLRGTLADPVLNGQIKSTVANLEKASENLAATAEQASGLMKDGRQVLATTSSHINDEQMWSDVRATMGKLRSTMDDLSVMSSHGRKVLTDPGVTEDLTASVHNVRKLTESGIEVVAKADKSLTRVDQTMNKVTGVFRSLQPDAVGGYLSLEGSQHNALRSDLMADLYYGSALDSFWRVGVRDIGDSETFVLQRGFPFLGEGTLRLGVLGSKLGLGFDYPLTRRLWWETDLWNPNDLRLDLRGLWRLNDSVDLSFGVNEAFGGNDAFVGLRKRIGGVGAARQAAPATVTPKGGSAAKP
ncbi:MlaD family protein [bacterium]|nr:MlaD family protein [bacterium]